MSKSHGSIPGYRPGPILSGPKKAFVASIFILPVGAYIFMQSGQIREEKARLLLEEEGRQNWVKTAQHSDQDLGVRVGRSGGGV